LPSPALHHPSLALSLTYPVLVAPQMLIVPPQLLLYLATGPEEKMRFIEGGERAVTHYEAGMAGYETRSFRELGVFTSTPYETTDDQDSVNLLQTRSMVGEFYRMHPPPVWDKTKKLPPNYADILVFDEDGDRHCHITFALAFRVATAPLDRLLDVMQLLVGSPERFELAEWFEKYLSPHYKNDSSIFTAIYNVLFKKRDIDEEFKDLFGGGGGGGAPDGKRGEAASHSDGKGGRDEEAPVVARDAPTLFKLEFYPSESILQELTEALGEDQLQRVVDYISSRSREMESDLAETAMLQAKKMVLNQLSDKAPPTFSDKISEMLDQAIVLVPLDPAVRVAGLFRRSDRPRSVFADDSDFHPLPDKSEFVEAFIKLVEYGMWMPFCITIARPFIEHSMLSAIVTVSGRDTGATLFGPADMQISANTSVKTIEGHYTCHTKSVITKPQNVLVLRHIMCNGYCGGGNCKFFGVSEDSDGTDLDAEKIINAITERLVSDDEMEHDGSMLAFLSKYDEIGVSSRDQVISISTRRLPWELNRSAYDSDNHNEFPGGAVGYNKYTEALKILKQIHTGEDEKAAQEQLYLSQTNLNNSICFIGPHRRYNPFSNTFFSLIPGQGHFGPDAIPGVRPSQQPSEVHLCVGARHAHTRAHTSTHQHTTVCVGAIGVCHFRMRAGVGAKRSRKPRLGMRWYLSKSLHNLK
jgi:hypothetical protein